MKLKTTLVMSGLVLAGLFTTAHAADNATPCVQYALAAWYLDGQSPYQAFSKCRSGSAVSDPHITTFKGISYDHNFPGDYALVELQDDSGFAINGRFIIDKADKVSSYTIPKAVQFNWPEHSLEIHRSEDSTLVVLDGKPTKVKNNKSVAIGEVGYITRKDSSYLVANTVSDIAAVVNVNKTYLDINITVPKAADTAGLLGHPLASGLVGRDGVEMPTIADGSDSELANANRADFVAFIESWRSTDDKLFSTDDLPELPDYTAKIYRLTDLSAKRLQNAEAKCDALAAELPERFNRNNCVFDMGFGGNKFSGSAHRNQPSTLRLTILD